MFKNPFLMFRNGFFDLKVVYLSLFRNPKLDYKIANKSIYLLQLSLCVVVGDWESHVSTIKIRESRHLFKKSNPKHPGSVHYL